MKHSILILLFLAFRLCSPPPPIIEEEPEEELSPNSPEYHLEQVMPDTVCVEDTVVLEIPHIQAARRHIGIPSTDTVNAWLGFVGLPPGNPFCAAAQSSWLHEAGVKEPLLRTGLARNYLYQTPKRLHIPVGRVLAGVMDVPEGSLIVFQRGNESSIFGHIGTVTEDWTGQSGMYISANTSAPGGGSEFSGGGVWEKPVRINLNSAFRVTDFVIVNY